MGGNLLGDLVQEEVRRRERIVAIDDEAVLMAPYASRVPVPAACSRRAARAPRFEDDGPTGAALLHDALRRLRAPARRRAAAEPVGAHGAARAPSTSAGGSTSCRASRTSPGSSSAPACTCASSPPEQAAAELRDLLSARWSSA